MEYRHRSVLLKESVKYLIKNIDGIYVDCTIGGGGHALHILQNIYKKGFLIGFDKDRDAIEASLERLKIFSPSFLLIKADFKDIDVWLSKIGVPKVDGVIADLGISSYQVDNRERGFSFKSEVLPDMRMDKESNLSAWDVLNNFSSQKLADIFRKYGEIKRAQQVATLIKKNLKHITTAEELSELIKKEFPKRGKIHPATLVFQALRIYVNDELGALESFLSKIPFVVKKGGRVVIISYHSLEDRIVKEFFKKSPEFSVITKKPIVPTYEEIKLNRRARSAKMRVCEVRGRDEK